MDITKIPSWIIAVSVFLMVFMMLYLSVTGQHICYENRFGFVDKEDSCQIKKRTVPFKLNIEQSLLNESNDNLFVTGYCQPTGDRKDLEGMISKDIVNLDKNVVASMSGADRIAISFVVPSKWHFKIRRKEVKGIKCNFTGSYI